MIPTKKPFRLCPTHEGGPYHGERSPFLSEIEQVGNVRTVFPIIEKPAEYVLEDRGGPDGLVWRFLREIDLELGLTPPPPPLPNEPGGKHGGHVFEDHAGGCDRPSCPICDGGLAFCTVCKKGEADLAPTCPGPSSPPPPPPRSPDLPCGDGPRESNTRTKGTSHVPPPPPPPITPPPPPGPPPA